MKPVKLALKLDTENIQNKPNETEIRLYNADPKGEQANKEFSFQTVYGIVQLIDNINYALKKDSERLSRGEKIFYKVESQRPELIKQYNSLTTAERDNYRDTALKICNYLASNFGEQYSLEYTQQDATSHVLFGNKIQFNIDLLKRYSTPLHELVHELDEKLARSKMISFLDHEIINNPDSTVTIDQEFKEATLTLYNKLSLINKDNRHGSKKTYLVPADVEISKLKRILDKLTIEEIDKNKPDFYSNLQYKFESFLFRSRTKVFEEHPQLINEIINNPENVQPIIKTLTGLFATHKYKPLKVLDEIPARLQEIIIFDSRKTDLLNGISELSAKNDIHSNKALSIVKTICEEHIIAMHEAKIDNVVVDKWLIFYREFNEKWQEPKKNKATIDILGTEPNSMRESIIKGLEQAQVRVMIASENLNKTISEKKGLIDDVKNFKRETSHIRQALERSVNTNNSQDSILPSPNISANISQSKDRGL